MTELRAEDRHYTNGDLEVLIFDGGLEIARVRVSPRQVEGPYRNAWPVKAAVLTGPDTMDERVLVARIEPVP